MWDKSPEQAAGVKARAEDGVVLRATSAAVTGGKAGGPRVVGGSGEPCLAASVLSNRAGHGLWYLQCCLSQAKCLYFKQLPAF